MGDWIAWTGGICPVGLETMIEYRLRFFPADREPYRCQAGFCRWDHGRTPEAANLDNPDRQSDIIAYRILPPIEQSMGEGV